MYVERTMQFILEEHARFVTGLGEVRAMLLEVAATQKRIEAILERDPTDHWLDRALPARG